VKNIISFAVTGVNMDHGYVLQHAYGGTMDDVSDTDDEVRPIFRPTPQNVSVGLGQRAVLRCRVDNLGAKIVSTLVVRS